MYSLNRIFLTFAIEYGTDNAKMYTLKLFLSILSMTFLPPTMQGQEAIHGVCGLYGDNVLWDLKGDTLLISGRGDMANYEWQKPLLSAPWTAYSE